MKKGDIFWIGYSDLMTSLFFVMLVLFTVTIGYLQYEKKITEEQLEKVKEIQASVEELPDEYFTYQPEYKRFKLNKQIQFDSLSYTKLQGVEQVALENFQVRMKKRIGSF